MLYQFEQLKRKLDQLGYPKIQSGSGFEIIRTDFKQAHEAGKTEFRHDGVYLLGRKGYIYMPKYRVSFYNDFPRFHLTRCSVIDDYIKYGIYEWSNDKTNDITDRDTTDLHKNQNLSLCNKCREKLTQNDIKKDTEEFFKSSDKPKSETDIFGYPKDQEKISKLYRKEQNYTCEDCGVQCKDRRALHKKWWHLHHIDGVKTNNEKSNLACLCICCHSRKDEKHKENFSTHSQKIEIESFVKEYKAELTKLGSPCI